jgi:hypothetical protein
VPDTPTVPGLTDSLNVYVEEYNSVSKTLVLLLLIRDLTLTETSSPFDYAVGLINQFYEKATVAWVEENYGLALVESGEEYPDETGAIIEIQEDYLLSFVQPMDYVLASVIDPQELFPFKYRRVRLVYRYQPDFQKDVYPETPGQPKHDLPVVWGYPPDSAYTWPYLDLGIADTWFSVWYAIGNTDPVAHWRYMCDPMWLCLLQAYPDDPDEWMQQDVYDGYRQAVSSDGQPWYTEGQSPKWISRGINDNWVDSYNWLKTRGGYAPNADRRELRWFSYAGWTDYRRYEQGASWVHVQILVKLQSLPGNPCSPYVGGGLPPWMPVLGYQGTEFLPLIGLISWLAPWLKLKKEE